MSTKQEISDISLRPATNGFVLSYTKKYWPSDDSLDNCRYDYPSEVFKTNEGDAAFKRMMELADMEEQEDKAEGDGD